MPRPTPRFAPGKEYPIPHENRYIHEMIAETIAQLSREYAPGDTPREFHPKQHALLRAEFIVEPDLPDHLRVGVFATPCTYSAFVRYSNSSHTPKPDIKKDVRGMVLKLTGVPGEKLLNDGDRTDVQDFLLASNQRFFARDIREFQKTIKAVTGPPLGLLGYLLSSPRHLAVLLRSLQANGRYGNLLQIPYWSTTPYQFGDPARAVKYHLRPVSGEKDPIPPKPSAWYLREAMIRTLSQTDVWFDFMVQFQEDPERMPIEDATVIWTSPYVKLARLRILQQDFATETQLAQGQNMAFNPWHSLPAHRPLGGPNRARRAIYASLSAFRLSRNQAPAPLPPPQIPTPMPITNQQRVAEMMTAYENKEIQKVLCMMSPDIVWFTPGDPKTIPFAGTHTGREGVAAYFGMQAKILKFTAFKPLGLIGAADGPQQVVLINETALVIDTQKSYTMDFALVITIQNQLVTHVEVLMDTQQVAEAFEK